MRRSSWFLIPLVLGFLLPRPSSAQSEVDADNLSAEEAALEETVLPGLFLGTDDIVSLPGEPSEVDDDPAAPGEFEEAVLPGPVSGTEALAPPPDETLLIDDDPAAPEEEVSEIEADGDLGDLEIQAADADELLPSDDPAAESDYQLPGTEEEDEVVEAPEPTVLLDDSGEDPEALATGEDVEIEDLVLPPEVELYTPPSLEETGEEYPPIDGEDPPSPELPPDMGAPPVLDPLEPRSIDEGQTLIFPVNAYDPDLGQTAVVHAAELPEGATLDGPTFSWTPTVFQAGTYTVVFEALDNGAIPQLSPEQTLTITVNDVNQVPVAIEDAITTSEDLAAQPIDPRANDGDLDDDALVMAAVTQGANGAVALNADGTVTYTPNADSNGTDSFGYTLSDGRGGTATGTVYVTVVPINDPPSFTRGADQSVDEDAGPQTVAGWATAITAGPANEADQPLSFTLSTDNPALFAVAPAVSPDGTLSYTPAPETSGAATATLSLSDGQVVSPPQTFAIAVNPVNDPPVLAAIADQTLDEGQELSFQVFATDIDSPVSLSVAGAPAGASLIDHQNGTADFAWIPGYSQAGVYELIFSAGDGSLSATQSVTLTVVNVTRTLTAAAGAGGTVTPAGVQVVDYGSDQTLTFTHAIGYHIDDILVDGVSVGAVSSYTFTNVTADHTIAASFAIDTFTLTAQPGANGGIAPANQTVVTYGSNLTYIIVPATGYSIADVLVDGVSVGVVSSYTFTNITADHILAASFADVTAPVVTAQLTGVWGRRGDDDDDDDGPMYRVRVSATDGADPRPGITAYITQPLTPPALVAVSYKKEKTNRIKIDKEGRKLKVRLEGPSEPALRALWARAFAQGGFGVVDNQVVRLTTKEGDSAEAEYRFDKQLNLTSAKGPRLRLVAYATDASGNESAPVEASPPRFRLSKSADEALAQGMEVVTAGFGLQDNYPNPFNPATMLRYSLDNLQEVRLTIYNTMGQRVRVLVDQAQGPGSYEVEWNGLDQAGQQVAGGIYFYRLQAGEHIQVRKMLFAK